MKRLGIIATVLILLPFSAQAIDKEAQLLFEKMGEETFLLVGVTYLCSEAIGEGHFHAARISAEQTFRDMGMSNEDAVIAVDDFVQRAKRDNPAKAPADNASKCMDAVLQAQTNYRVTSARFVKRIKQLKKRDAE